MGLRQQQLGPIAVDIGTAGVKLLQIDPRGARPVICAALSRPLPAGLTAAEREQRALAIVDEAVRSGAFRGRRVVLALQPSQVQTKSFRLPRMPREELESALQIEAEERFGFGEPGQYRFVVAGDVRQGNETREELIAFGVRESQVAATLGELNRMKLVADAMDLAPCAMARGFSRFLRREEDAAAINVFIDVGHGSTDVVMTRGVEPAFVKTIEVGGGKLDEAVARRLESPLEEARRVRLSVIAACARGARESRDAPDRGAPDSVREVVYDGMRPIVDQLVKEVLLCLRYFAVTFRGQQPQSITFVGGEAHNPLLAGLLAEIIDVPCLVGDPLRGIDLAIDPGLLGSWVYRPAWGVAAGLALRGSRWLGGGSPARVATATAGATA